MTMKGEEFFELLDEETMDTFKELIHTTRLMKSFLNDQIIADLANLLNPLLRLLLILEGTIIRNSSRLMLFSSSIFFPL